MNQSKDQLSQTNQNKKRSVVRYEALSPELLEAFNERYPRGYNDYLSEVFKVDKPDGSFFYVTPLETDDARYLVKVDVKIDDYEDVERGLFGSDSDDDDGEPDELPDSGPTPGFIEEEVEEE